MKTDNRREFLKKSVLGISGVAIVPGIIRKTAAESVLKSTAPELPVRLLGKTGLKVPLISMGSADASTSGLVRAAYEAGVRLFFSARYYGEGKNEQLVGEGLKGLPRDSFIIGTAVPPDGMDMRTGTFIKGFDADAYIKKAEGSLRRFGLDYVDVFLFPFAGKKETVLNEGVLKALSQLKKQGKTRFPFILLLLLVVANANAQTVTDVRVLSETPNSIVIEFTPRYANTVVTGTDGVKYTRFQFHGAAFDQGEAGSPLVPFRPVLLQLPSRRYSVEVLAQDYDDLAGIRAATRPSLQAIKDFGFSPAYFSPKPKYLVSDRVPRQNAEVRDVGVSRGLILGTLRIYPIQFSLGRNEVRVFRRIVVRVNFTGGGVTAPVASAFLKNRFPSQLLKTVQSSSQNLVSDSPLAQGDWYRMEVTETGIYRIDQSFLSKAGISSSAIGNINSIRIFGNDGKELPEDLNVARPNGNVEIPRLVVDNNGNGVFDADDFILFYGKSPRGWTYSPAEKTFHHYINHYTESNVYFLTFGGSGRGKNMDSISSTSITGGYKLCIQMHVTFHSRSVEKLEQLAAIAATTGSSPNSTTLLGVLIFSTTVEFRAALSFPRKFPSEE